MKKILIVGQGIAGTVLAWTLRQHGAEVTVVDAGFSDAASRVAAGIINPVTGKRYAKSWRVDEFLPFARNFYAEIEAALSIKIWHNRHIIRLLNSVEEENNWSARCGLPDFDGYMGSRTDGGDWSPFLKNGFRFGELRQAAQVDFAPFLRAFREKMAAENRLWEQEISPPEIENLSHVFDHVILCLGHRATLNPFFPDLPWQLAKGEVLLVRLADARAAAVGQLLKKKILLAPLGSNLFWAGANYEWEFADTAPSETGKQFVINELREMLGVPFEIENHVAGVRPVVSDRRPLVGFLPENERVGIYNGFGSKGTLLAPYWAAHFAEHILESRPLAPDIDVRRFY
ncbi:MAG: NAD(P)/FAD-dependent oxidoreductase [Saprospiraceae bacterium]